MPLDTETDLTTMLTANDFGVTATFETVSGGIPDYAVLVTGIFDKEYYEVVDSEAVVESSQPAFTCRAADVTNIKHGDRIKVSGDVYKVVGNKPDGTGIVVLALEEV